MRVIYGYIRYFQRSFQVKPSGNDISYEGDLLVVRKRPLSFVEEPAPPPIEAKKPRTFEEQFHEFVTMVEKSDDNDDDPDLSEMIGLLPAVILNLKEANQFQIIKNFFIMVAQKTFPLKNIALHLFLDVVKWFSREDDTEMRYSPEVKSFWRISW